jgi:acetyl esterase/lipase
MKSRHLVHPDLLAAAEALPPFDLRDETLVAARAQADQIAKEIFALDKLDLSGLRVSERMIPGAPGDPDVRILLLEPEGNAKDGKPRPAILETHGGGHVMGTPEVSLGIYHSLVRELGATMVLVDYRLSPETPFPGPLEDCYAALKWMVANAVELSIDLDRIAVTGGSAGATLAAGVALLARDRDQIPLCFLHLSQPMLDDRTCIDPELSSYVGEFCWTRSSNAYGWQSRLGVLPGSDGVSPYAAPGRMEDLSGLPPTFINCGALDLFVEESLDFAKRLIRGGVPVDLRIYAGAPHGAPLGASGSFRESYERDELAAWRNAFALSPDG